MTPAHCARHSYLALTWVPPAMPIAITSHFKLFGAEVGLGDGVVCMQQPNIKGARLQLEPLNITLNTKSNQSFLHVFQLRD